MALALVFTQLTFDDLDPAATAPVRISRYFVDEGLSRPFRIELDVTLAVADPKAAAAMGQTSAWLGRAATFSLTRQFVSTRSWNGVISCCSVVAVASGATSLRLTLVPRLELLRHDVGSEIYVAHTVRQLVECLVRPALGPDCALVFLLDDSLHDSEGLEIVVDCRIRFRESRLDYVHRLLHDFGLGYWLAAEEEGEQATRQTLFIFDKVAGLGPKRERTTVSLPLAPSGTLTVESLHGLISSKAVAPRGVLVQSIDPTQPFWRNGVADTCLQLPDGIGGVHAEASSHLRQHFEGKAFKSSIAQVRANALANQYGSGAYAGTGATSDALALIPGDLVRIVGSEPSAPDPEDYRVVAIQHTGEDGPVAAPLRLHGRQGSESPGAYHNRLELVPGFVPWQHTFVLPQPVPMGVHSAIVLGRTPNDDAPYVDDAGRVFVQILGILHTVPNDTQMAKGIWVRASQFWAGAGVGAVFWPRPGMEVLVGFMGAHNEEPVLLGCAYNGNNSPPYAPAEFTFSCIKTQPDGNELSFQDAPGREEILLDAKRDLRVEAHEFMSTEVGFAKIWRQFRALGNRALTFFDQPPDPQFDAIKPELQRSVMSLLDATEEVIQAVVFKKGRLSETLRQQQLPAIRMAQSTLDNMLPSMRPAMRETVRGLRDTCSTLTAALDIIGHKDDRLVSKTSIFGRAILHVADSVKATIQKKLDLAVDDGVKATLVALTPDRASACSDAVTLKARQALRLEQALGSVVLEKDGIRLSATEIGAYAKKQRVEANQEIVLRQGKCAIKLRNNGIEICAPKIQLTGDDVQIRGSRSLKLKSPKTSID